LISDGGSRPVGAGMMSTHQSIRMKMTELMPEGGLKLMNLTPGYEKTGQAYNYPADISEILTIERMCLFRDVRN